MFINAGLFEFSSKSLNIGRNYPVEPFPCEKCAVTTFLDAARPSLPARKSHRQSSPKPTTLSAIQTTVLLWSCICLFMFIVTGILFTQRPGIKRCHGAAERSLRPEVPCAKCYHDHCVSQLTLHSSLVSRPGIYPCQKCGIILARKDNLHRHIRNKHGTNQHFWCQEDQCRHMQNGFKLLLDYRKHMRLIHNIVVPVRKVYAYELLHRRQSTASSGEPHIAQPDLQTDAQPEINCETQSEPKPILQQAFPHNSQNQQQFPFLSQYEIQHYRPVSQPVMPQPEPEFGYEQWNHTCYIPRRVPAYVPDMRYHHSPAYQAANELPAHPVFDTNIARARPTHEGARLQGNDYLRRAVWPGSTSENKAYSVDADGHDRIVQLLQQRTLECQELQRQCTQLHNERDKLIVALMAS